MPNSRSFNIPWRDHVGKQVIVEVEDDGEYLSVSVHQVSQSGLVVALLFEDNGYEFVKWYKAEEVNLIDFVDDPCIDEPSHTLDVVPAEDNNETMEDEDERSV